MNPTSNESKYQGYEHMISADDIKLARHEEIVADLLDDSHLKLEDPKDIAGSIQKEYGIPPKKKPEREVSQFHLELPKSDPVSIPIPESSSDDDHNCVIYWRLPIAKLGDKE